MPDSTMHVKNKPSLTIKQAVKQGQPWNSIFFIVNGQLGWSLIEDDCWGPRRDRELQLSLSAMHALFGRACRNSATFISIVFVIVITE